MNLAVDGGHQYRNQSAANPTFPSSLENAPVFVGHYGVSYAGKAADWKVPLWVLFLSAQFLGVLWGVFVLLGVERVRITPGITATNPLDLYYIPDRFKVGIGLWNLPAGRWLLRLVCKCAGILTPARHDWACVEQRASPDATPGEVDIVVQIPDSGTSVDFRWATRSGRNPCILIANSTVRAGTSSLSTDRMPTTSLART